MSGGGGLKIGGAGSLLTPVLRSGEEQCLVRGFEVALTDFLFLHLIKSETLCLVSEMLQEVLQGV